MAAEVEPSAPPAYAAASLAYLSVDGRRQRRNPPA
jgi:hypothetical protein